MGNGIGFTELAPDEWKKLVRVIRQLGGDNIVFDAPAQPEIGDAIEALLSLLRKKGVHVTRDEFLDELSTGWPRARSKPVTRRFPSCPLW